ncbi:hypothetical protein HYH03_012157 [Edaphochlamys debaryana]|uniref:Glycosyltransferase family 32 protein n=1 Tax=Edaphochlamys debaryana TaxID=47281 RepID=A0A836BUE3_9CHLO|nr:hypothetical protein HYH03_012157 [Edaphochlamys debaryana]|eukprot:KAG2489325.1 hypothetical protein HYH03_012157 [Edaphochlamys debaryana]
MSRQLHLQIAALLIAVLGADAARLLAEDGQQEAPLGMGGKQSETGEVPHIIHHMHGTLDMLSPTQKRLRERCMELNPKWEFKFWDDVALRDFIQLKFPWYYKTWSEIEPLIKQLDTSRYMLMNYYGGIYLDVDVECVTPFDSLVAPLPRHAAWMGDFPEPMFLMSSPGNAFWLYALHRIARVWRHHDAWHSTGPAGLNAAAVDWVRRQGWGVLVPWLTDRTEPEFHEWVKTKNNTVPWYELSDWRMKLEELKSPEQGTMPKIWYSATGINRRAGMSDDDVRGTPFFPVSATLPMPTTHRVGFVANELLDPPGCGGPQLEACKEGWCNTTWPQAYVVHHCLNTWRGRIGTTRRLG